VIAFIDAPVCRNLPAAREPVIRESPTWKQAELVRRCHSITEKLSSPLDPGVNPARRAHLAPFDVQCGALALSDWAVGPMGEIPADRGKPHAPHDCIQDWATAVDAIVRRTPESASERDPLRAQVRLLALLSSAAPLNVLLDGLRDVC